MGNPYNWYIKSELWLDKKAEFRAARPKQSKKCFVCEIKDMPLHIHHVSYERLGFEDVNDLVALCGICHAAVHQSRKRRPHKSCGHHLRRHIRRKRLAHLRHRKDKRHFMYEVARFFNVLEHEFTKRILIGYTPAT